MSAPMTPPSSDAGWGWALPGFLYTLGLTLGLPVFGDGVATADLRTMGIGAAITVLFIGVAVYLDWREVRRRPIEAQS